MPQVKQKWTNFLNEKNKVSPLDLHVLKWNIRLSSGAKNVSSGNYDFTHIKIPQMKITEKKTTVKMFYQLVIFFF